MLSHRRLITVKVDSIALVMAPAARWLAHLKCFHYPNGQIANDEESHQFTPWFLFFCSTPTATAATISRTAAAAAAAAAAPSQTVDY